MAVTKTRPNGDANRAKTLQGLRAGPMISMEMTERWSFGARYAVEMLREGLVELVGDEYRLTPAGRAACPFRNEKAATAAAPEVFTMPKGETKLTLQQVLDAILATGSAGITRKTLIEKFSQRGTEQAVDMHITALNRMLPAVIFKPKPGVLVGVQFPYVPDAAKIAPKTASTATDDWIPEPLATDPAPVDDLSEPAKAVVAEYSALVKGLPDFVPIVDDIRIDNPDTVEFAIYSSGGMDIYCEDCAITLDREVLAKLRAFLGRFAEAA